MIGRDDVLPLLLAACPSFQTVWADLEHDEIHVDEDGTRLHYLDASELATHLVALHRAGEDDEVRAAFEVIERLHAEGDPYVRELATIGYLEDVQGDVLAHPDELAFFESVLGPESAPWWCGLLAFWSGRAPLVTRTPTGATRTALSADQVPERTRVADRCEERLSAGRGPGSGQGCSPPAGAGGRGSR